MGRLPLCFFIGVVVINFADCRKVYNPPVLEGGNHFLNVDGFIDMRPDHSSTFQLTRSLNLSDTMPEIAVLSANVQIISSTGSSFSLVDSASSGSYTSTSLNLDPSLKYQLSVTTSDGSNYQSDFVTPKMASPIDSVTWALEFDPVINNQVVNIYLYSKDPLNNTRYYRWDYIETWIHTSFLSSHWVRVDGMEVPVDDNHTTHTCYSSAHSNNILLGSTEALSSDVVSKMRIATFIKDDPKMDTKYSMLVRQFPLDAESYKYWLSIQKNSQSLGGLFDLQPGQVKGNMHSVTHPEEPVVGYVSASAVQEQRIFIDNDHLPGWQSNPLLPCAKTEVPQNPVNPLVWDFDQYGSDYQLYYFSGADMVIVENICVDCRVSGGDTTKPAFWK